MRSERAFTLIELLTIIAIIGILSTLGMTCFNYYKASAAYSSAETTMRNARNAIEAAYADPDNMPGAVPLTAQTTQGQISDPNANEFLPGLLISKDTKFQVSYDPTCENGACMSEFLQVNHCFGKEFLRWMRFGDGVELSLDHVAGAGCS